MATKSYSNIDKPVQLVEIVGDNGDGTGNVSGAASGGVYNTTLPTLTNGQLAAVQLDQKGNQRALMTGAAFAVAAQRAFPSGFVAAYDNTSQTAARALAALPFLSNGSTLDAESKPFSTHRLLSAAASTNGTSVKVTAGDLFKISGYNASATARFLKLYNKASAPTVGSDTPIWTEYLLPTSRFSFSFEVPLYFSAGIAYALTVNAADADTTALTAADIVALNMAYA